MNHYICTGGCDGVSDTPGTCQAETCPKHKQPLTACNCADGQHAPAKEDVSEDRKE